VRVFIAVELSDATRKQLQQLQRIFAGTGDRVKWTDVSSLHITLRFLGQVEEEALKGLYDALRPVADAIAPFSVELAGVGAFPQPVAPRVIWVGVQRGRKALEQLAAEVNGATTSLGYAAEKRAWIPHLTLGRVKSLDEFTLLPGLVQEHHDTDIGTLQVDGFGVIQSRLTRKGPIYTALQRFPLEGAHHE